MFWRYILIYDVLHSTSHYLLTMQLLISTEMRLMESPEEKAASIKHQFENLSLKSICSQLKADYQQSYRRLQALKRGVKRTDVGRPPLIDNEAIEETQKLIEKQFREGDSADYEGLRKILESSYRQKLSKMTTDEREKYAPNFCKNYVYDVGKRMDFNTRKTNTHRERQK